MIINRHTTTTSATLGYNKVVTIIKEGLGTSSSRLSDQSHCHCSDQIMIIDDHPKHKDHLVFDHIMIIDDHQKHDAYLMVDQPSTVARHAG